jgi:GT2 family glycosyltransferase
MKISVVILNWNGEKYLQKFLPFLLEHTTNPDSEIVVADNASSDNSIKFITDNYPTVRIIELDKNYGFAGGYNKALAQVDAEYYVLLNSDVEVTHGWLTPMIDYLDNHAEISACQPKILSYAERNKFEYAGAAGGFIDYLGYAFCRGRVMNVLENDNGQHDSAKEIFWATGACFVIRSEVFRTAGGFDDDYFAHFEEIDLCWRLNSRGYKIACVPQSAVYHVGGGTLTVENPYKTYLNFRNSLFTLYKNLPQKSLKKIIFLRTLLDCVAAIKFLATFKFQNAASVVKAHRHYYRQRQSFDEKRKQNLLYSTCTTYPTMLYQSLLWDYYFNRKKTFNQIIFSKKED